MDLVRFFIMVMLAYTSCCIVMGLGPPGCGKAFCKHLVCFNYSPMTARIWPMVCMERIRFFFIDIFKFLLKVRLYWAGAGAQWAAPWLQKNCLRDHSPMTARISPMFCMPRIRFFFIVIVGYLQKSGCCFIYIIGLLRTLQKRDQKRSERIRLLPYSSIALTRSCFTEFFFIAIPPKKVGRINRK